MEIDIQAYLQFNDQSAAGDMAAVLGSRARRQRDPEIELLLAILMDAVEAVRPSGPLTKHKRIVKQDAIAWFSETNYDYPFAFAYICSALNLDVDATRRRALNSKVEQRSNTQRNEYWSRGSLKRKPKTEARVSVNS